MKVADEVRSQHALDKVPTGIQGFDEISEGGIPRGRATLIAGGPGTGKTIFALQSFVNGVRLRGEPGIFVAFEENSNQIIKNADTFGWNLPSLIKDRLFLLDARVTPDILQAGEFDLSGLLAGLSAKATQMGAKHIVFDSIDILLALLDDPFKERQEVYRLHEWLLDSGLTGFITTKTDSSGATLGHRYDFVQFMVDCVVLLSHGLTNRVSLRELRIAKYRGSPFSANAASVTIGSSGMEVAGAPRGDVEYAVSSERVSTGIARFDLMLDGGYYRGSSVLISGSPGTAKSTLAGAVAGGTCQRGERAIYISFDEAAGEIIRNFASVGIELRPHLQSGLLQVHGLRTESGSAEEHLLFIRRMIEDHQPTCLVVDPLSAMIKAGGHLTALGVAQRLIRMTKQAGITTVCTSLVQDSEAQAESTSLHFVSTIADTWIHLSYLMKSGERNRALTIVKSRGTKHSNQVRELVLSDQGVDLREVYTAWGEVLMGTARWQKEAEEETERARIRIDIERKQREVQLAEAEANARMEAIKRELEYRRSELETLLNQQQMHEERTKTLRGELAHKRGGAGQTSNDSRE